MTLQTPVWLFAMLAVAGLVGLYVWLQRRRRAHALRFTNTALLGSLVARRSWRRHLGSGFAVLALGVLVFSLAGPRATLEVPRNRATVMLALDVSLSMRSTDITPTRFRAMQSAATQFVDLLPAPINLGLISFSGSADTLATPTTDHAQVRTAIGNLQLAESTAIGEAIFTGLTDIQNFEATLGRTSAPPPARIVLLSDGYNTVGRSAEAAIAAAKTAHVPVSTIAFGTDSGTMTLDGETVAVPVDHATLQEIATDTGGSYAAAASAGQLRQAYRDLGAQIGYTSRPVDIAPWFVGAGVLLALLGVVLTLLWTDRLL